MRAIEYSTIIVPVFVFQTTSYEDNFGSSCAKPLWDETGDRNNTKRSTNINFWWHCCHFDVWIQMFTRWELTVYWQPLLSRLASYIPLCRGVTVDGTRYLVTGCMASRSLLTTLVGRLYFFCSADSCLNVHCPALNGRIGQSGMAIHQMLNRDIHTYTVHIAGTCLSTLLYKHEGALGSVHTLYTESANVTV